MSTQVFDLEGDFASVRAAEAWCAEHGFSVGAMQRGAPRGLLFGDFAIAKWRNLDRYDKAALHGRMTGDMRCGPVTVRIDMATQPGSKEPHATQAESRPDGQDQYLPSSQASSQTLGPDEPKKGNTK